MFEQLFFKQCKRMNVKLYSHQHWDQVEERQAKEAENLKFYKEHCNVIAPDNVVKIDNPKIFKLR